MRSADRESRAVLKDLFTDPSRQWRPDRLRAGTEQHERKTGRCRAAARGERHLVADHLASGAASSCQIWRRPAGRGGARGHRGRPVRRHDQQRRRLVHLLGGRFPRRRPALRRHLLRGQPAAHALPHGAGGRARPASPGSLSVPAYVLSVFAVVTLSLWLAAAVLPGRQPHTPCLAPDAPGAGDSSRRGISGSALT